MPTILANVLLDMFTKADSANFLLAYLAVLALMITGTWGIALLADKTGSENTPEVPTSPDPYEIAYLRGGPEEILRLVLFDLANRGYALLTTEESVFSKNYWLGPSEGAPPTSYLTPLERHVLEQLGEKGARLSDLLQSPTVLAIVQTHCANYEQALSHEELLLEAGTRKWIKGIRLVCLGIIAMLGAVKLLIAQDMLLFVAIITAITLAAGILGTKIKWRTDKGERYLEALKETYSTLKQNAQNHRDLSITHSLLLGSIYGPQAAMQEEPEEGPLF